MEVKAQLKYYRVAPRKVRLVTDVIRGISARGAVNQLKALNKKSAVDILKLLNSAISNATNNFSLEKDNLFVKKVFVNQGPALKRWMPMAHGRAGRILKFTSHITIVLDEYKPTDESKIKKVVKKSSKKDSKKEVVAEENGVEKIIKAPKPRANKTDAKLNRKSVKTNLKTFVRKAGDK